MSFARTAWVTASRCRPLYPARPRIPARSWLIVFLLLASTATAQEQAKDIGDASLEELANITVYTASRHTEKVTDAPSSVTVITRDEVQKYGYRTLADILRSVRGFDVTYDRTYCYLGVGGINRLSSFSMAARFALPAPTRSITTGWASIRLTLACRDFLIARAE